MKDAVVKKCQKSEIRDSCLVLTQFLYDDNLIETSEKNIYMMIICKKNICHDHCNTQPGNSHLLVRNEHPCDFHIRIPHCLPIFPRNFRNA
jgi:hypothetical protein